MPITPKYLATFPKIIPTAKKSVSENVVAAPPKSPKKGKNNNGKNVMSKPFSAEPATAPRIPPRALPNTPDVAPKKKCATTPGKITTPPNKNKTNIPITPTMKLTKKPINTAFCAYGKTIGQSNAGFVLGTSFSEIPLNAGTISAKIKRTPVKIINTPAANVTPCINENTMKFCPSLISECTNAGPANSEAIK